MLYTLVVEFEHSSTEEVSLLFEEEMQPKIKKKILFSLAQRWEHNYIKFLKKTGLTSWGSINKTDEIKLFGTINLSLMHLRTEINFKWKIEYKLSVKIWAFKENAKFENFL